MRAARFAAQRSVNTERIRLYWGIGATICSARATRGGGAMSSAGSRRICVRGSRR
ncbi:hypothetical protein ITJ58_18380 [Curtobacterium flaccumfaciens]|nr:hypothetical protein [Curtobacterium flaccumfaciens]